MGMKSRNEDILGRPPASPDLRDATKSGSGAGSPIMPKPSAGASAAAMAAVGQNPAREVVESMAEIENAIKRISKHVPAINQIAQPFIQQMRDVGMAGVANLAQGGTGSVDMMGSGAAPPPGMPQGVQGVSSAGSPLMPMPPM